jgi:PAS domain S-box-containing protein
LVFKLYHDVSLFVFLLEDLIMAGKPTYEELEQRVKQLEKELTEREHLEEAIRENVSMFEDILDKAADGICVCHNIPEEPYVRFTHWNPQMTGIVGYTMEEINKLGWYQTMYPDLEVQKWAIERMAKMREGDNIQAEEWMITTKSGEKKQLSISTSIVKEKDGKVHVLAVMQDITERKNAEEALRQSEKRIEKINECFLSFGTDTNENINRLTALCGELLAATCALYNRLDGDMLCSWGQWNTPVDYNPVDTPEGHICYDVIKSAGDETLVITNLPDTHYAQTDPNVIPYKLQTYVGRAVKLRDDHVGSLCVVYQDDIVPGEVDKRVVEIIASAIGVEEERKRAEDAVRESEEKFRFLTENIIDIVWILDRDFQTTYVSPSIEKMLGFTTEERKRQTLEEMITPESLQRVQEKFMEELARDGEGIADPDRSIIIDVEFYHKNGSTVWMENSVKAMRNPEGLIVAMHGVSRNITERRQAEETIRKSEELLRATIESTADGILVVDEKGQVTHTNKRFAQMWRIPDEFISAREDKKLLDFVLDQLKDPEAFLSKVQVLYKTLDEDFDVLLFKDDRVFERFSSPLVREGHIAGRLWSFRDITESKRREEALRESEEKLARSKKMESLGLLAGGVAHDLNNVLSGIVSYPELILMDLPEDSKLRKPIETMQESGHRAAAIVQDLITVARGVATTKEPLNLNDLIGDYLNSPEFKKLEQFYPAVTVKTNLDTDLFNIGGSHVHIRKVVMNLVSNASEAIEGSGNITISTMNRYIDRPLRGYDDVSIGEYVVLAVSDDGSGISSDDLERIFEPFYTKKVMGRSGTGLGLSVVWNVVQDHKGYIDVTTSENGTTFELYFPITREKISGKDLSIPIKDYKGDGETILVVDDVESQREISCKMLDTLGYRTQAVSSGKEAVEYLKEHTIDLILLDMIMDPGINGRETYEQIIKIHPNQKAIIASGFAETDDVKEAQKLGAGQYIKKPLTLEKIGIAVRDELKK